MNRFFDEGLNVTIYSASTKVHTDAELIARNFTRNVTWAVRVESLVHSSNQTADVHVQLLGLICPVGLTLAQTQSMQVVTRNEKKKHHTRTWH